LWRGEPLKTFKPGVVVSDGGENAMDKGGVGTIDKRCSTVVSVGAIVVKGEALLAEIKAVFGSTLKADAYRSRA
jgi:hypothetical protein